MTRLAMNFPKRRGPARPQIDSRCEIVSLITRSTAFSPSKNIKKGSMDSHCECSQSVIHSWCLPFSVCITQMELKWSWNNKNPRARRGAQWTSIMFDDRITNHWVDYCRWWWWSGEQVLIFAVCLLHNFAVICKFIDCGILLYRFSLAIGETNDFLVRYPLSSSLSLSMLSR